MTSALPSFAVKCAVTMKLSFIARSSTAARTAAVQLFRCSIACTVIAAFADNGHDVFNSGNDAWWPDTRLPLRLIWFPDGLIVARVAAEHQELLGARITRIEGLTPERLLARLHALCGGTECARCEGFAEEASVPVQKVHVLPVSGGQGLFHIGKKVERPWLAP